MAAPWIAFRGSAKPQGSSEIHIFDTRLEFFRQALTTALLKSPHLALGKRAEFYKSPRMSQNHIDVRYVAGLARLELSDEEVAEFQPQLDAIMEHVDALTKLDVDDIDPTAHPAPVFGRMREDVPHPSLPQEAVLQNAPDQAQDQIRVPKVVADA